MAFLFLACLRTLGSTCKCFGYNLLKGRDPWGSWKQLGVPVGAENSYLHQGLQLPEFLLESGCRIHIRISCLSLYLRVAMWLVLTNEMWKECCMSILDCHCLLCMIFLCALSLVSCPPAGIQYHWWPWESCVNTGWSSVSLDSCMTLWSRWSLPILLLV